MNHELGQRTPQAYNVSLASRMLSAFSLVMALSAIVIVFFIGYILRETTWSAQSESVRRYAETLAQRINTDIENHLDDVAVRASNIFHMGLTQDLTALQRAFERLQNRMPEYAWIGYASPEGKVLAATGGLLVGDTLASLPWFQPGLRGPTVTCSSGVRADSGVLRPQAIQPLRFIDLAHPVRNDRGEVIGVLAAHLGDHWFEGLIHLALSESPSPAQALQSVISKDGAYLMGAGIGHEVTKKLQHDGRSSGWLRLKNHYSSTWLVGFARHVPLDRVTGELNWTTVVQMPADSINTPTPVPQATIFAAIATIVLIAWMTFAWLVHTANRPIKSLIRQINHAQHTRQEIAPLVGLPKEFVQLRHAVNELTQSLRSQATRLTIALEELQRSYRGVTDSFPGVLFSARIDTDHDWSFTYLSPSAEYYLGIAVDPLPIRAAALCPNLVPDTRDTLVSAIRKQSRAGDAVDVLIEIAGSDGRIRHMRTRAKRRLIMPSQWAWDGVMLDVSDLVEARQRAAAADSAKSDFLASVSHEIRTPLNGMLGLAQLLLAEVQAPTQKADLIQLIDSAKMLTTLLNDVLDHSRIEAGELNLESRPFLLSALLDSCSALFRVDTQQRGLRFEVKSEFPRELSLIGDPTRLRQIFINLLSNAVKFTREGSVTLRVAAHPRSDGQITLSVSVTDTGPGISTENQSRLFRRFDQGDRSVFRQHGGTGLGLSIVKRLIDAMGGRSTLYRCQNRARAFG